MGKEFYCGHCGKFKDAGLLRTSPAGKRPVCSLCKEKQSSLKCETTRDKKRARDAKRKTLAHLLPNAKAVGLAGIIGESHTSDGLEG